ncbi:MAG TPA: Ppx/GppA phosphatase family protein [Acidimicrobiales bacterium]|jgi:exopolyphosphatase/guanosine-5'-triphosphate,3'-diphosphate pyrophosphatase
MRPDVLAAVDLGTNSVHLVVARIGGTTSSIHPSLAGTRFEVIEREREMVRLGSSAGDMKRLSKPAMDRGIDALNRFRQVADIYGARLRVVATSAVREAENRGVFLQRAWDEAKVEIEVISGFEEARLIHLGVLQAVPVFDQRLVVCDIGGGSTELVVGERGEVLASRSLKLGAIRLTQRFFPGGRRTHDAVDACRRYVEGTITPFASEIRRRGWDVAVGSSGTIGALCEVVAAARDEARPRTFNNFTVRRDEIDATVGRLLDAKTVKARAKVPGLDPRRADIILGGAIILEQVVAALDLQELTFSDYALREGVLLDTWQRTHGGSLHHLSDLRRRSVVYLVDLMDEDPDHSTQVARLALQLFDGTCIGHGLGDDSREVLEAAALLANIGLFVSHSGHHKHSYYVIRNSEHLAGFTDREIELIAQVARYHRKSAPRVKHAEFAALSPDDQRRVIILAGLLRVAVGLDRNHGALVRKVRCHKGESGLVIEVVARNGENIALELYSATQRKDLLEQALGYGVDIVAATRTVEELTQ